MYTIENSNSADQNKEITIASHEHDASFKSIEQWIFVINDTYVVLNGILFLIFCLMSL